MRGPRNAGCDSERAGAVVEPLEGRRLMAASYYVAPFGDDANPGTDPSLPWRHIQKACDAATPGSTVTVLPGKYREKLVVNVSGNATDGPITFQAQGRVVLSGKGVRGADMIFINNHDFLRIVGFEIRDNRGVDNGSGIRLTESAASVEIRNNRIHHVTGTSAMGITVYGSEPVRGISGLVIEGNEIYKCTPAPSEAVAINGNVHDFVVRDNYVHHVNNIGIDVIGGEGRSLDPATDFPRNGVVAGNRVTKARFAGGGRDAAGIYVDGAEDVIIERNVCWGNDVGIEINAIHPSRVARRITVRDNFVALNNRSGVSVGGSDLNTGSVQDSAVTHNTLYRNDARRGGAGEVRVQNAAGNMIANNVVSARRGGLLVNAEGIAGENALDYNVYFAPGGEGAARYAWGGVAVNGLAAFRALGRQDVSSLFADPLLARPGRLDLHLLSTSPAIDAGNPAFAPDPGETDVDGGPRVLGGRADAGADEAA